MVRTDRIIPRNGSRVVIENLALSGTPTAGNDIVPATYAQSALASAEAHTYISVPFTATFPNGGTPVSMTGYVQKIGDVVTMAWNGMETFAAGGTTMVATISDAVPLPSAIMRADITYSVLSVLYHGSISFGSDGTLTLSTAAGPFVPETSYSIVGGSLSWLDF